MNTAPETPSDFRAICAIVNGDFALQSLLYDIDLLPEQTYQNEKTWPYTATIARHWVASFETPKVTPGGYMTDEWIDAVCSPGREKRWHGDGRQYDRDTARLIVLAALQVQRGITPVTSTESAPAAPPSAPASEPTEVWLPMDTAPRDGSLIRLLVNFTEHNLDDDDKPQATIGMNNLGNTAEDQWQFCGWNWAHDCFTQGEGTPIGWLPMLATSAPPSAAVTAEQLAERYATSGPLLELDALLAKFHAAVWEAGADEDGKTDFDLAGTEEAKEIQGLVRSMLAASAPADPLFPSLRRFLDGAAGDGFVCGGVDAADLYLKIFGPPDEPAREGGGS